MNRRSLLRTTAAGVAGIAASAGPTSASGDQETPDDTDQPDERFSLTSAAFENGGDIPQQFTCDGENQSPPFQIESPPDDTESYVLVMDDPDAPDPPFVHWLLWDIPADTDEIPEAVPAAETVESLDGAPQGTNGAGEIGYVGPCPPEDDPQHTYLFSLYALEESLGLDSGAGYEEVLDALFPVAIARARYVGQYRRAE